MDFEKRNSEVTNDDLTTAHPSSNKDHYNTNDSEIREGINNTKIQILLYQTMKMSKDLPLIIYNVPKRIITLKFKRHT